MGNLTARRRALLGGKSEPPWEILPYNLNGFLPYYAQNIGTEYDSVNGSLRVYAKSSNTPYSYAYKEFTTQSGYEYRIEYDVQVDAGKFRIGIRKGNTILAGYPSTTISTHVDFTFPHNSEYQTIAFYPNFGLSDVIGDCTVSNFVLSRRAVT